MRWRSIGLIVMTSLLLAIPMNDTLAQRGGRVGDGRGGGGGAGRAGAAIPAHSALVAAVEMEVPCVPPRI